MTLFFVFHDWSFILQGSKWGRLLRRCGHRDCRLLHRAALGAALAVEARHRDKRLPGAQGGELECSAQSKCDNVNESSDEQNGLVRSPLLSSARFSSCDKYYCLSRPCTQWISKNTLVLSPIGFSENYTSSQTHTSLPPSLPSREETTPILIRDIIQPTRSVNVNVIETEKNVL